MKIGLDSCARTLIWPLPMPSPIFMAYCMIMATSSSTAYSSPVSETMRAVPRAASLTTLYGSLYLAR